MRRQQPAEVQEGKYSGIAGHVAILHISICGCIAAAMKAEQRAAVNRVERTWLSSARHMSALPDLDARE